MNGRELTLSWHELRAALWHPLFVALVLVIVGLIISLGPYDAFLGLHPLEKTLFYANGVASFIGLLVASIGVLQWRGGTVHTFAALAMAVVGASVWGIWFGVFLGAHVPTLGDYLLITGFNMTFALLAEVVLVSFLLGRILDDLGIDGQSQPVARATASPPPAPLTVEVLGRQFLRHELLLLAAEEHYVSVTTSDGKSVLLRGNLSDAVVDLPETLGFRVHRSTWVARQAVAQLQKSSKGWRLQLRSGAEVSVARSRQADVAVWVESAVHGMEKAPQGVPFAGKR